MNNKKFCPLELARQLKDKGFNLPCEYIYANHWRVRNEILLRYPGLSDDGYRDLTIEGGGTLKEDEVYATYIEPLKEYSRNTWIDEFGNKICTMPTLDDARTWLRDTYNYHIVITPGDDGFKAVLMLPSRFGLIGGAFAAQAQIYNPEYLPAHPKSTTFPTWEAALTSAIEEALKYVGKWNKV